MRIALHLAAQDPSVEINRTDLINSWSPRNGLGAEKRASTSGVIWRSRLWASIQTICVG